MTYLILLALLLGNSGGTRQPHETCDLIELNSFYTDEGKLAYRQYIFYDYSPDYRRYDVVEWCLDSDAKPINRVGDAYAVTFRKLGTPPRYRTIRAKLYRETHTQHDPERVNKKLLDEKFRRVLRVLQCER